MLSATDRAWLSDDEDVALVQYSVRSFELRELEAPPVHVLEWIERLAPRFELQGHAAKAFERGRWGVERDHPYFWAVVRVAPARPGTAVTLRLLASAPTETPSPESDGTMAGVAVAVAVIAFRSGFDLVALAVSALLPAHLYLRHRRGSRRAVAAAAAAREEAEAWGREFWAALERSVVPGDSYRGTGQ